MPGHSALFSRTLDDGIVQCCLCPHQCRLKDGQRGLCWGRRNEGGRLVLTTYGLSSGFAVDPVEKKPLYHFLPGTDILSFGTAGCNLACSFCQNWNISHPEDDAPCAVQAGPDEIAEKARDMGIPSVAFTYNEPIVFAEYVMDTARACRSLGIKTVAVTAGYISDQARFEFFRDIDAANVDLKSFRDDFYRRLCRGSLKPVLDTLVSLKHKTDVWLEITALIIPQENDSLTEIREMSQWIARELGPGVPLHLSAFHPDYMMLDRPRTRPEILRQARLTALDAGLRYVYTGNISDDEGSITYCPSCGKAVIIRRGFDVIKRDMDGPSCGHCGTSVEGVFS